MSFRVRGARRIDYGVGASIRRDRIVSESKAKFEARRRSRGCSARRTELERGSDSSRTSLRPLLVIARRAGRHELIDRGAALTYYSVLSLVPALLVLFSVIGLFGDQDTVNSVLVDRQGRGPGRERPDARSRSSR